MKRRAQSPISNGVDPVLSPAIRKHSGIGYIVIDSQIDRETYINNCYRDNTVTIVTNRDEIITKCLVDKNTWQNIKFPLSSKERGSCIIWLDIPILNKVVVIGTLNKKDEVLKQTENSFTTGVRTDNFFSEQTNNGEKGEQTNNVNGKGVFYNIYNDDETGVFKVYVQGDIIFEAEKEFSLKSASGWYFTNIDDQNSENEKLENKDLKSAIFRYKTGEGFLFRDEYENTIETDEEGINIIDNNGNKIFLTKDGFELIDDFENEINTTKDGILIKINDLNKKVRIITKDADPEEFTLLGQKTLDIFGDIVDKMAEMASYLSSAKVVIPTGLAPLSPDDIAKFTTLNSQIRAIKSKFNGAKSKTLKTS